MHNAPPPLNALRFFEAAAWHLSLTKAALELNVTRSRIHRNYDKAPRVVSRSRSTDHPKRNPW
jgi:hypothetical protein